MVALSWSNTTGHKFPDLVPVPYIHAALAVFARNVGTVQERLQHAILIENPWCYLAFARGGPDPFVVIGGHAADLLGLATSFAVTHAARLSVGQSHDGWPWALAPRWFCRCQRRCFMATA